MALRWMSLDLIDDKSTLVLVMAWCRQATSPYLSQSWLRSMSPNGVTRPQWVKTEFSISQYFIRHVTWQPLLGLLSLYPINTLRPRQNGCHFPDNIFKWIFLNKHVWIKIKISLKFVPKVPINNIPALVLIRLGAGQATSHYLNQWWLFYWSIHASLGLNELYLSSHCDSLADWLFVDEIYRFLIFK